MMNELVRSQVLEGEILGPEDAITIYCSTHLLSNDSRPLQMAAGSTIQEIVEYAISKTGSRWAPRDYSAHITGGYPIPRDVWHLVRPKPGGYVILRPVPAEPISLIIGAISTALGSIGSVIAGLGFFGKLLMFGIGIGIKFLMNKLFAPPEPVVNSEPKVGYSITGSRNRAAQWEAVPVILGKHRVVPTYAAPPYTETIGIDQYLHLSFCVGYGPLTISEIKIGETAIEDFEDVTVEIRNGYTSDAALTLYPYLVQEEPLSIELLHSDGWVSRTTAPGVTIISIDLVWPQGLTWLDAQGSRMPMGSYIGWRFRPVDTVDWLLPPNLELVLATQDTVRRTLWYVVAPGQYEIEVQKLGPDSTEQTVIDTVQWTAIRGLRTGDPIPFADPLALIAVKIRATGQLSGTVDTLNCIATSRVTAWNGVSWVANTESRNPASLVRAVWQHIANKRPIATAKIDLVALQGWSTYCSSQGFTYDKPITILGSVDDIVFEICAAGRAMPVWKDGKRSVVWDEQTPIIQTMLTSRNSWDFQEVRKLQRFPHAYRIRFVNALKKYVDDERIVYDDGYNALNATDIAVLDLPGSVVPANIWKHGRFHIAQTRLRPSVYTRATDWEGIRFIRNDRVRVEQLSILVRSGSGRVIAVDSTPGAHKVTVDEILLFDGSADMMFVFRLATDTSVTRLCVVGTVGELKVIPLSGAGTLPAVGDMYAFGTVRSDDAIYRILGVEPQRDYGYRLTLTDDAPEIYNADTGAIPDFDSNVSEPQDPFDLPPRDIRITDGAYLEGTTFQAFMNVSWILPRLGSVRSFEIQYKSMVDGIWKQAPSVLPPNTSVIIGRLLPGLYTVRVRNVFNDNTFSSWLTSEIYNADALLHPPADVTNFRIATAGSQSTLYWDPIPEISITYQVRFAPASVLTPTWNNAVPLIISTVATSAQVQTMVGTYLIKGILASGVQSANATSISSNVLLIAGLNAVEDFVEAPIFAGVKEGVEAIDDELRLGYFNTMSTWDTLTEVITLTDGDGETAHKGFHTEGTYYFNEEVDLGIVYTSRVTAALDIYGFNLSGLMNSWDSLADVEALDTSESGDWWITLEIRTTIVDPVLDDWTSWQQFIVGDYTCRGMQFRIKLYGASIVDPVTQFEYTLTTPSVKQLSINIDMPDRDIAQNDVAVPAGGLTVSFIPPFKVLKGIGRSDQNLANGDRGVITAQSAAGFTIQFLDSGGSGVARTFDYVAKGYGEVYTP